MRNRVVGALTILLLSVTTLVAPQGQADVQATSSYTCDTGEGDVISRPGTGALFNSVWGVYYAADTFEVPADYPQSGGLLSLATWMLLPTDAPLQLQLIEGTAINGPVQATAVAPAGQTGKVQAHFARPVPLKPGATYIMKVTSPTSTRGQVQRTTTDPARMSYYNGGTGDQRSTLNVALEASLCRSATVSDCGAEDQPTLALTRPTNGAAYNSIYGPFYAADLFQGVTGAVGTVSAWLQRPTTAPVQFQLIPGSDINGAVAATTTAPAGQTGKVTATFDPPVPVVAGQAYILKVSSPTSTTGLVEQTADIPDQSSYFNGGRGDQRSALNMALEVTFTCAAKLVDFAAGAQSFGPVTGQSLAAQPFIAPEATLASIGVRLSEANNGPLSLAVRRGTIDGPVVATAALEEGPAGLRQVTLERAARVAAGATYVLVVQSGDPATTTGAVLASTDQAAPRASNADGPTDAAVSVRLWFLPSLPGADAPAVECAAPPQLDQAYIDDVNAALTSRTDSWGEQLLASPAGPTYDGLKDRLKPLLHVGSPAGRSGSRLTDSGVYYVPLGQTADAAGDPVTALHVADGSQIRTREATGPSVSFAVGDSRENFGQCLAGLGEPSLAEGYLPVMSVPYVDVDGNDWVQESLVDRAGGGALASYIAVTVTAPADAAASTQLRLGLPSTPTTVAGGQIRSGDTVLAVTSGGGSLSGSTWIRDINLAPGQSETTYVIRPHEQAESANWPSAATPELHATASEETRQFWQQRLAEGAQISVPEDRVMDAMRNLLMQNLQMGWRYSLGNAYETFYQPESSDAAQILGEFGFDEEHRANLEALLTMTKGPGAYENWEWGEKLTHAAQKYRLDGDRQLLDDALATHRTYVQRLRVQQQADPNGLLTPQTYSGDIPDKVYALHHIAVVWRGVRDMAQVWNELGHQAAASEAQQLADDLGVALNAAVQSSWERLGDGALFVPERLLADVSPYDPITDTKFGSYYNLVAHYGYGTGILAPGSADAQDVLEYLYTRGSTLLGMVRFNYYPTAVGAERPGGLPGYKTSGVDNVYGVQLSQFMADNDEADRLVLALYGKLAHGMTRGTYIAGEGDTVGPVAGEYYRSMYLPPSSANNGFYLKTLRSMLAHEITDDTGQVRELQLAYATPRDWLSDGKSIQVADLPTQSGGVGYALNSQLASGKITGSVTLPDTGQQMVKLRLRLPAGHRIERVRIDGAPHQGFDVGDETIDLTGMSGTRQLEVTTSTTAVRSRASHIDHCAQDQWLSYVNPEFKNQGQCVRYVTTGRKD